jgi:hypothetical protein
VGDVVIFIAYASDDAIRVRKTVERFRDAGLEYWLAEIALVGSPDWRRERDEAIAACSSAVIFVTARSVDRAQVITEIGYCVQKLGLERVLFIRLDEVPIAHQTLSPYSTPDMPRLDEAAPDYEGRVEALIDRLFRFEPGERPIILPVAAAVPTLEQFERLEGWFGPDGDNLLPGTLRETWNAVLAVCAEAGLGKGVELFQTLRGRYGPDPESFRPFGGDTLRDTLNDIVRDVNDRRRAKKQPPIYLRWYSCRQVRNNQDPDHPRIRRAWAGGSLRLIDVFSTFIPGGMHGPQGDAVDFPHFGTRTELALELWLPPSSVRLFRLEAAWRQALVLPATVGERFTSWVEGAGHVAFDHATPTTTRRWLQRVFLDLEYRPPHLESNRQKMGRGRQLPGTPGFNPSLPR